MLSYSLVLALFLLGPGFATYAGVFTGFRGGKFQASPPPPNSIFSLAVVGMSALTWHAVWAFVLAIDEGVCAHAGTCFRVPFQPDIYSAALAAGAKSGQGLSSADVAAFLLTCLALSVAAYAFSITLVRARPVADALRRSTYGLYSGLVQEASHTDRTSQERYVTAYVVTDMQRDGGYLGYVGVLENLQVGADKQIAGIALVDCNTFLVHLGRVARRTPELRSEPMARIIISGGRIQNVAFTILELD